MSILVLWQYLIGFGTFLLVIGIIGNEIYGYVSTIIELRKQRGLRGYDPKQFTKKEDE
jgi:hypothetical protein